MPSVSQRRNKNSVGTRCLGRRFFRGAATVKYRWFQQSSWSGARQPAQKYPQISRWTGKQPPGLDDQIRQFLVKVTVQGLAIVQRVHYPCRCPCFSVVIGRCRRGCVSVLTLLRSCRNTDARSALREVLAQLAPPHLHCYIHMHNTHIRI